MVILGIETSCDETAIAVIDVTGPPAKPRVRILSNVVASQVTLHAKFGGVVPHLAKREHQRNLVPVLLEALHPISPLQGRKFGNKYDRIHFRNQGFGVNVVGVDVAVEVEVKEILEREPELFARIVPHVLQMPPPAIDAIAVTVGPGLAPALWVGGNFSRALAYLWKKPLIPVNHLEGHVYTNLLSQIRMNSQFSILNFQFPALCLIVSGGHTELVLMRRYGDYRVLGETRDDAAGEAFDKVAKMFGLGFPGGPIISRLAEQGNPAAIPFPRPMLRSNDFNFSFSGLKTAVLYALREKLGNKEIKKLAHGQGRPSSISHFSISDFCASFEQAVVDVLVAKTIRAAKHYRVKTVMIGGGVAANKKLRQELGQALNTVLPGTRYLLPDTRFTGDNALMIALAGYFRRTKKSAWRTLQADANLRLG